MSNHTGKVPKWLTNQYLEKMLQIYFNENSLHIQDSEITPGSSLGDNYICQVFRIKVHYANIENKTMFIIAKVLPKTELAQDLMNTFDFYGTEVKVFKQTLPALKKELDKSMGKVEPFFPQMFYVDEPNQVIFMEDLKQKGYQLAERTKSLDLPHSLLVMKALASLHASSYLLLKNDPNHKNMYMDSYWGGNLINNVTRTFFEEGYRCLLKSLSSWPISEDKKAKIRNKKPLDLWQKSVQRKEDGFNLLLHGDCWINNVMFKYNNGIVENVKLLDFQLVNYNSIGIDFNYFIFRSVTEDVRTNHLDDLLSTYYDTFVGVTGNIDKFSLDTIREEFHRGLTFGFLCQLYFRPGILAPEALDLDANVKGNDSIVGEKYFSNVNYIREVVKMLPFFEEHGIL